MKVIGIIVLLAGLLLIPGCSSSTPSQDNQIPKGATAALAVADLSNSLPPNTSVVFKNVSAIETELAETIMGEISLSFVDSIKINAGGLGEGLSDKVVAELRHEADAAATGEGDNESAARFGRLMGADFVANCYIKGTGNSRHFGVKVIDVVTALPQLHKIYPVLDAAPEQNPKLAQLISNQPINDNLERLFGNVDTSLKGTRNTTVLVIDFLTADNAGAEPKINGFGTYMADQLTNTLLKNASLSVKTRADINQFCRVKKYGHISISRDTDLQKIAQLMGVDLIVRGQASFRNDQVRIRAAEVRVADLVSRLTSYVDMPAEEYTELNSLLD